VLQNAADDLRIFDAGDDLHRPAAAFTGLDLDTEDAFEALRPVIAACLSTALPCPSPDPPAGLTSREVQVLSLLVHGHTNTELARRLHISAKTIDHHVSSILEKLEVRSRTEAVAAAFGLGIIKAAKGGGPGIVREGGR
jgi:DNA-binding NarL/FixJ family response regulator